VLLDIVGVGAVMADTKGGQKLVLRGEQFGPATSVDEDGKPVGSLVPLAR